jgi:hypothetical protein
LQLHFNRSAIALHSLFRRFAIALLSLCYRFTVAMQTLCNHFAIAVQSLCDNFAIALPSLCDRSGPLHHRFAITFRSLSNRFAQLQCDCHRSQWLKSALHRSIGDLRSLCNHLENTMLFKNAVQSICSRYIIAPQSLRNQRESALRSLCNCSYIILQFLRNHFVITLESHQIALQSLCNRFE